MRVFNIAVNTKNMLPRLSELPRLPVPPLKDTVDRYLKSVKPFLSDVEMATTKKLADDLSAPGGVGEKLHRMLQERATKTDNWLTDWWQEERFLGNRNSVIASNAPAMRLPRQEFKTPEDQLAYAASLVQAVLALKAQIDNGTIPTESLGGFPQDMMQYGNIFGAYRQARIPIDALFFARSSQHIVVTHRGNLYKVMVYAEGRPLKTEQLFEQFHEIVKDSLEKGAGPQVGILTTWHRDRSAETFASLSLCQSNNRALQAVREALILLCLDDPLSEKEPWDSVSAKQLLVGGKNGENAGNRWWDKIVQFIVGAEGNVGVCFEHSVADGTVIAGVGDFVAKHAFLRPLSRQQSPFGPEALKFETNRQIEQDIQVAKTDLKKFVDTLEMSLCTYEKYGKEFIKSYNLSPDSFIQIALQLAFYRLHNAPGFGFGAASLRRFLGGRLASIRSCSEDSMNFCRTFLSGEATDEEKVESLKNAVEAHKETVNLAVRGMDVDRLFLGLRRIAVEADIQLPDFFHDKSMLLPSLQKLDTSQVACRSRSMMFFASLTPDGYACCYNPSDHRTMFGLSAYKDCTTTSMEAFKDSLLRSLDEMRDILVAENSKRERH